MRAILTAMVVSLLALTHVVAESGLTAWASIPPHASIAQMIGGDRVQLESLLSTGDSPETFQMRPSQLKKIGEADLFFLAGLPFDEILMKKLRQNYPNLLWVDLRESVFALKSVEHDHHGSAGDPHMWLDPTRMIVQAKTIRDAYISIDPGGAAFYQAKYAHLEEQLTALDRWIASELKPYHGRSFYVYHSAFGYFADAYGLHEESLEVYGHAPSPRQLNLFVKRAREQQVSTIFIQPQFRADTAGVLAESIAAELSVLDPLSADYFSNLKHITRLIKASFNKRVEE